MKSILIIVPYDHVYPPMNGGMKRCFHIIHQLSLYFDLTVITFQSKQEFLTAGKQYPTISKIKLISTKDTKPTKDTFSLLPQKLEHAFRYRWLKKQLSGSADGMFLEYYPALKKLLKENHYDGIILENLATLNAISIIRKYDNKVKIIYDAHNVDTNLAIDDKHASVTRKTESNLHENIDALFTCSEKDRLEFQSLNKQPILTKTVPNGVTIAELFDEEVRNKNPKFILFCGLLGSAPNSEGLLWFYNMVWNNVKKRFPQLKLLVVGSGKLPLEARFLLDDRSLVFSGPLDDVKSWYNKAAISIVPLLTGSGTRLKILEAMSLGLPVVSTSKGAEGIHYTHGQNIIIADEPTNFADGIIKLLDNVEERKSLAKQARKLAEEEYDWNKIGLTMKIFLLKEVFTNGK